MNEKLRNTYGSLIGKPEGWDSSRKSVVDGRIMWKRILKPCHLNWCHITQIRNSGLTLVNFEFH